MHEHPTGGTAAVNSSVAHPARVHNAWLGGRDNYPAEAGPGALPMWCGVGRKPL
ncbi:SAM-dependent methyltransferase [Streptomyces sp. NPDC088921]|uniref:SAM-dependent methyltransferase n=1 Tax=unclassified Streptomyces TaxID=2593676 RepID=UPI00344AD35B